MQWTIEIKKRPFEGKVGEKLSKVIKEMVEFYGVNNEDPDQIESISCYYENSREKIICDKGVSGIQERLDAGVLKWRKDSDEGSQAQKDLQDDYRAGIL